MCGHTVIVKLSLASGHIMTTSHNHIMDPSTFEMLFLLKVNKNIYNVLTLDKCIEEISNKEEALRKHPLGNI